MALRSHSQKKLRQQSTSTPVQNQVRSRPFAVQAQPETRQQEVPDVQTQLETAQRFGHSFSKMSAIIQHKLTIGAPGDQYEQEADRVAQQVVQRINAPGNERSQPEQAVQRETMPEEEEELQMKPTLQRQSSEGSVAATTELESAIQQSRGRGQPLADDLRQPLEQAFGNVDFSGVNVHTDAQSDQLNRSIQAKAFTTGQDIYFRQGAYQPGSRGGQELIAHELAHVVQQNGGAVQRSRLQPEPQLSPVRAINQSLQRVAKLQPIIIQRTPLEDAIDQLPNKAAKKKKNVESQLDTILNTILPLFLDRTSIAQDLTPIPKREDFSSQAEWNKAVGQANTQRFAEMPNLMARQRGLMGRLIQRIHALRQNAETIKADELVGKADHALRQAAIIAVDFTQALPSERSSLMDVADDFGVPVKMPNPIDPETYNAPTQFDAITATVSTFNPTAAPGQLNPQPGGADPGQVDTNLAEVIARLKDAYVHYLLQKADYPGNLLGVFLGPEWFFGSGTPYSGKQKDHTISTLLAASCQFPNMVIVPGTIRYSPDKKVVVNFAPVICNGKLIRTIAKRFWGGDAPQNFVGMEHEKRQKFVEEESRLFNVGDVSFALDICQDTNVGINTAKKDYYSTLSPGNGVKVHLVTAGGAIPQQGSVTTQPGGAVFGSDAGGAARFYQTDPNTSTQANSGFLGQEFVVTGSQVHRGNSPGTTRDKEIKTTVSALQNVDDGGGLKHMVAPIPIGGLASENVTSMDIAQVESNYKYLGKPGKLTNDEERALLQGIQQYATWFQDKPEKIKMLSKMWLPIEYAKAVGGPNVALATQLLANLKQIRNNWINTLTGLATGLPQLMLTIRNDMNQYQQAQFSTSTGLVTPAMTNDITDWLIDQLNALRQQVSGAPYTNCADIYQQVVKAFQVICESAQDQVPDPAQYKALMGHANTIRANAEAATKANELLKSW